MRRVRIAFVLLSLALLGAAGLVLQRALASVEEEGAARRAALAERAFDEMERVLSIFLDEQDARGSAGWLAPAAHDPAFVSAHFEIGSDDSIRLTPAAASGLDAKLSAWAERRGARRDGSERDTAAARPAQSPLYDALQSLNRGAEGRTQRERKLEALAEVTPPQPRAPTAGEPRVLAAAEPAAPSSAPAEARVAGAPRVAIDPLLGDRLDESRLVLVRTVLTGERGYRQGLVLDVAGLGAWLRERGLGADTLPGASLEFAAPAVAAPAPPGSFAHRFAEPFAGLVVTLVLPPLPDSQSAAVVVRLSLLLAVAAAVALIALYRMVAVALRYAEQRSRFVAAVSHELKTPLTAIRMYGEMLRDGLVPTDEKRAEYYRTITGESERLSRLIDNVLEFARAGRGEARLALRSGPLAGELPALCDALRPQAAEAGFALEVSAAPDAPPVSYDRDAVAQILVNLVDNALKYARGSSHRVVRVRCDPEEGGVALRVRDFGPGVAPRDLERIFELFRRGDGEPARATRGTGLGLALVRSLAHRMGARVSARNAEGGGLEVSVVFPSAAGA